MHLSRLIMVRSAIGNFIRNKSNWGAISSCFEFDIQFHPLLVRSSMFKLENGRLIAIWIWETTNKKHTSFRIFNQKGWSNWIWEFCKSKSKVYNQTIELSPKEKKSMDCSDIWIKHFVNECKTYFELKSVKKYKVYRVYSRISRGFKDFF